MLDYFQMVYGIIDSLDNVSTSNVYCVLNNEKLIYSFYATIEAIERLKNFKTEKNYEVL